MTDQDPRAHLGRGWAFPVRPVDGRLTYAEYESDIDEAIEIILRTDQGERVMLPPFGAGTRRLVFEPNSSATHRIIERRVRQALLDWEPRIDVERVHAAPKPGQENVVFVHLDYRVRTSNSFYNRVFPFYLTEAMG